MKNTLKNNTHERPKVTLHLIAWQMFHFEYYNLKISEYQPHQLFK
jgi:thymidylate synthase